MKKRVKNVKQIVLVDEGNSLIVFFKHFQLKLKLNFDFEEKIQTKSVLLVCLNSEKIK